MNAKTPLVRFIAPAYPNENIFSRIARRMTPLGLIMVATAACDWNRWRVEVIDENDYTGPRTKDGLPDHEKLQEENPAEIVAFYCGLTCTMDRVYELARFYQNRGAKVIAGGKHVMHRTEEALGNCIDAVVIGEGERIIQDVLSAIRDGGFLQSIFYAPLPETQGYDKNLDLLPYPDYGLVRYAKVKCYSIGRVRGCSMFCEFCTVNDKPRWSSPEHLFNTVRWLVDTRGARNFFIVDDNLGEDIEGYTKFFQMVKAKFGNRLCFTVQIRLSLAHNSEFLTIMKEAGGWAVCVGFESVLDQELKAMHKGLTSRQMLNWARTLSKMFWLHMMFIYRYPGKNQEELLVSDKERERRHKWFIRKSGGHSIQILQLVPLPGSNVEKRLKEEGRLIPVEQSCLDGVFVCYVPRNISIEGLHQAQMRLMRWFYSPMSFWWRVFTFLPLGLIRLISNWNASKRAWRQAVIKYGGYFSLKARRNSEKTRKFLDRAKRYLEQIKKPQ